MMATTDTDVELALQGRVVIGTTSDGTVWAGTESWLVRDADALLKNANAIEGLANALYDVPLTAVHHRHSPTLTWTHADLVRLYTRPDGKTVRISHSRLLVVESILKQEDEFGEESFLPDLALRQSGGIHGPVGFFVGAGKEGDLPGQLAALVMPMRVINDHLEELGRETSNDGRNAK